MSLYVVDTEGEIALAAAGTTKYALGVRAGTQFGLILCGFEFSIDGEAAGSPVEVAVRKCTFATNAPGTNSTSVTTRRVNGLRASTGIAGAKDWTSAPTVVGDMVWGPVRADSEKFMIRDPIPLLDQPDVDLNEGFVVSLLVETGDTVPTATWMGKLFVRRA